MGTNYYFHESGPCRHCGREDDPIHIGKSSGGWCFALHVIDELGIRTLDDWESQWDKPGSFILDEYGERITPFEMRDIITKRKWHNGTKRHNVDGRFCIGNGPGTYDYIVGDFS